ncbi:MAG TPA: chloride channel protein [Bacilli bacterium]
MSRLKVSSNYVEPLVMFATLLRWFLLASATGIIAGLGTSLFLRALFASIEQTEKAPLWIHIILLPVGGLLNGLIIYYGYGKGKLRGKDSVIAAVHERGGTMPVKTGWIKPLAAIITLASGGSAGKEGPCAHIGGSLAAWFAKAIRLNAEMRKRMITCGISAGFASVFGTPIAGTIYGIEVLTMGQLRYDLLFPAFVSGVASFEISRWMGIPYFYYPFHGSTAGFDGLIIRIFVLGTLCGLVSWMFIELNERFRLLFGWMQRKWRLWQPSVPLFGGLILSVLILFLPADYLGLSLPLMDRALNGEHIAFFAFFWKIVFVAITLGSGFYGGIVTPQFVIGAAAGNVFAHLLHINPVLGAAIGMVAVVAASSNTPIAAIAMGFELFGSSIGLYMLAACIPAYIMVGHRSVYPDQLVTFPKSLWMQLQAGVPLKNEHIHISYGVLKRIKRWQKHHVHRGAQPPGKRY